MVIFLSIKFLRKTDLKSFLDDSHIARTKYLPNLSEVKTEKTPSPEKFAENLEEALLNYY